LYLTVEPLLTSPHGAKEYASINMFVELKICSFKRKMEHKYGMKEPALGRRLILPLKFYGSKLRSNEK